MSANIRTKIAGDKVWYSAKDVFTTIGVPWNGSTSLDGVVDRENRDYTPVKTTVGTSKTSVAQYVVNLKGIKQVCKFHKKSWPSFFGNTQKSAGESTVTPDTLAQIEKLNTTVKSLQGVIDRLLSEYAPKTTNTLILKGKAGKVVVPSEQVTARQQTREIVQAYASNMAKSLNYDEKNRRDLFDLSFNRLYRAYKDKTPNNVDLKTLAENATIKTGTKTSGLQIAEKLGIASELLALAKTVFPK